MSEAAARKRGVRKWADRKAAATRCQTARRLQAEGLTYDQIAEAMDISRAGVHRYLRDADPTEVVSYGTGDWAYRGHFAREADWAEAMQIAKLYDKRRWENRAWRVRLNLDEKWPRPTR